MTQHMPWHIKAITLLGLIAYWGVAWVVLGNWQLSVWFAVGVVIGLGIFWFDELVGYQWYQDERLGHRHFMTRSIVMGLVYVALAVLMIASSGSLVGMGLTTSLLASYLAELWGLRKNLEASRQRFFWQINRSVTTQDLNKVRWLYSVAVVILGLIQLR